MSYFKNSEMEKAWARRFPNFKPSEVLSFDGLTCLKDHGKWMVNLEVLDLLQELRTKLGPLQINSGYRSFRENTKADGKIFSSHIQGNAFDVTPLACSLDELVSAAKDVGFTYVYANYERNYVHMDWRPVVSKQFFKEKYFMSESKNPIKSLSVWGNIGALTAFITLLSNLSDAYQKIPPGLIDETKLYYVALVGVISSGIALIGRWRAVLPLWPLKKK